MQVKLLNSHSIEKEIAVFEKRVRQSLKTSLHQNFPFTTEERMGKVLKRAKNLAKEEELSSQKILQIRLAIYWIFYCRVHHSKDWSKCFDQETEQWNLVAFKKKQIKSLIRIGIEEFQPIGLPERILHDALWTFLGKKSSHVVSTLLRIEEEKLTAQTFTEKKWNEYLLQLMSKHPFYTASAQRKYGKRRYKNMVQLRTQITKTNIQHEKQSTGKNIGRGVDTLFRVNFQNHISISNIADGKANIMISINTILISIIVTLGSTNISIFDQELSVMSLPIICLMLTCLVSLIFAILSTRPKISEKPIDQKSGFNLLFFNHFLQVSRSQFLNYINGLKNDHEKLYEELGKDLYNLGGILKKKYSLLTYAYNSFLIGMIITLISFFITKF